MSFSAAIRSALTQYVTFSGRAMRSEYWWFYLFTILVGFAAGVVDGVLSTAVNNEIGVVGLLLNLALLLPTLAVTARRLHDTGRSGWWMLLPMVPAFFMVVSLVATIGVALGSPAGAEPWQLIAVTAIFGLFTLAAGITLLVFLCQDSNPGPNKYGPSPKEPTGPAGYYPQYGYPHHGGYPQYGQGYPQPGGPYGAPPQPGDYPPPAPGYPQAPQYGYPQPGQYPQPPQQP